MDEYYYYSQQYNYWEILQPISRKSGDNAFYLNGSPYKTKEETAIGLSFRYSHKYPANCVCLYNRGRIFVAKRPFIYIGDLQNIFNMTKDEIYESGLVRKDEYLISRRFIIEAFVYSQTNRRPVAKIDMLNQIGGWLKIHNQKEYRHTLPLLKMLEKQN